jgi:predicted nucleotidyltransferase component of viral defense system
MVEFARHPILGTELTMRGGTCLHKLWLPRPYRYSEDLDYVRTTTGGVGPLIDAVREIAERGCGSRWKSTPSSGHQVDRR